MSDILISYLKTNDIAYGENESVACRSSFKVGGKARLAIYPKSRQELIAVMRELFQSGMRYEVIGNASNTLFAFEYFDGVLVFTCHVREIEAEGSSIYADCGVALTQLARLAADRGLSGLEFAYGIPGLVGGSVYMNAGAYGSEIGAVLEYSDAYDIKSDRVERIYDHGFGYRQSIYMSNSRLVCLGASFKLGAGDPTDIKAKMAENMASRKEKQPLEFASAGSYFKRPAGHFAGKLIEDCGLKGMSIGGARVSEKHAGFIINTGSATVSDILSLEEKIKEIVFARFGVELEREVRLIK